MEIQTSNEPTKSINQESTEKSKKSLEDIKRGWECGINIVLSETEKFIDFTRTNRNRETLWIAERMIKKIDFLKLKLNLMRIEIENWM